MTTLLTRRRPTWSRVVLGGFLLGAGITVRAQQPPPVGGMTAVEGTTNQFYAAAHEVIVTTIDGVEHVYHFTKDLLVHGGKGAGVDALQGLREGTTVVVHYTAQSGDRTAREIDVVGNDGLKITEGVVTHVDHKRKQLTIRYDNGKTETLRLTDQAAAEAATAAGQAAADSSRVIVYYADEAGQKVAHFFKKAS